MQGRGPRVAELTTFDTESKAMAKSSDPRANSCPAHYYVIFFILNRFINSAEGPSERLGPFTPSQVLDIVSFSIWLQIHAEEEH